MTIGNARTMIPTSDRRDMRRICESLEQGIVANRSDWESWFNTCPRARLEFRNDFEGFHAWLRAEARQGKPHRRDEWEPFPGDSAG